jgi:hypothetical protein
MGEPPYATLTIVPLYSGEGDRFRKRRWTIQASLDD